jgi:hypothetical protein
MTFVLGNGDCLIGWMRLRRGFEQTAGPSALPQDDICFGEWRLFD